MEPYIDYFKSVLYEDFGQSWIFVSIAFFVTTIFLRWILTSRIKKCARRISSKNLKSIQSQYLFHAISGWFFYLLSLLLFNLYWYTEYYQIYGFDKEASFFAALSGGIFLISIISHTTLYAAACLSQIKILEDKQLTP